MDIDLRLYDLNWNGILWGSLFAYLMGALWYSPILFADQWMKAQPHRKKEDYTNSSLAMGVQAVATFFLAVLCGILYRGLGGFFPMVLVLSAVIISLMYASSLFLGHRPALWFIDCGYRLVMVIIIGLTLDLL